MALKIISLRVPVEVLHACGVAAAAEGCSRSAWMVRALESALSEAKGAPTTELAGPAPVPSKPSLVDNSLPADVARAKREGVRPAAPPRASGPVRVDTPAAAQGWAMDRQRKLNAGKEKRA